MKASIQMGEAMWWNDIQVSPPPHPRPFSGGMGGGAGTGDLIYLEIDSLFGRWKPTGP